MNRFLKTVLVIFSVILVFRLLSNPETLFGLVDKLTVLLTTLLG
jgi:hypothetical protein